MKRYLIATAPAVLLFFAPLAEAQTTAVTATVTDPNGIPYSNATVKAQLVLAGAGVTGQPTVTVSSAQQCASAGKGSAPCQIEFPGTVGPLLMDQNGSFTVALQDNTLVTPPATQWLFTVSISPGIPLPNGTGPQSFNVALTISGASQSVTSQLSATAPALGRLPNGALSAKSLSSSSANPARTGFLRLEATDALAWRNPPNNADMLLIPASASPDTLQAEKLTVAASDTFVRANENPIAAPWLAAAGGGGIQLLNNAVSPNVLAANFESIVYTGVNWPNDQSSQATLVNCKQNAGFVALVVRSDNTGQNFYYADLDCSPGFGGMGIATPYNIQKIVAGVQSLVCNGPYVVPQFGDVFKVTAIGTTIFIFQNNVQINACTDTSVASGKPGIFLQTTTSASAFSDLALTNWSGSGSTTGFDIASRRLRANLGTAFAGADTAIVLTSGWGTSPSVSAAGGFDQNVAFSVTAGTTPGANPVITVTFKDGTWTSAPFFLCSRNDTVTPTPATFYPTWTTTATTLTITMQGTPTAANVYKLGCLTI